MDELLQRRSLLLAGGAWILCLAPGMARADDSTVPGRYRYAGGKAQRERFEAAVEFVVSDLNLLVRPIARSKLLESQRPAANIDISHDASRVTVERDGAPQIRGPADGTPFSWKNRYGDKLELRMSLEAARLQIRFKGKHSRTVTTYRSSEGGSKLSMLTIIKDPRLPRPLSYGFGYKRA